jgi:mono/diheme cytochrome c family protein
LRLLTVPTLLLALMGGIARAGGGDIFQTNCLICHQANAQGLPGMYPPLADSVGSYVAIPAGRAYLVHVVSFGMTGAISAHDEKYDGVMQPWPQLSDEDLADLLNYALTTFNAKLLPKNFTPLTADETAKYRAKPMSMSDVHTERAALLKALAKHRN